MMPLERWDSETRTWVPLPGIPTTRLRKILTKKGRAWADYRDLESMHLETCGYGGYYVREVNQ